MPTTVRTNFMLAPSDSSLVYFLSDNKWMHFLKSSSTSYKCTLFEDSVLEDLDEPETEESTNDTKN